MNLGIKTALPADLPIFPLSEAVLFPRGVLPLHIFEPRYVSMLNDALASGRMIGMIQPRPEGIDKKSSPQALFETGCCGRISYFEELEGNRFMIELAGVARFKIIKERLTPKGYRLASVDFTPYMSDLDGEIVSGFDRERFLKVLKIYLRNQSIDCDKWNEMQDMEAQRLIACLCTICPLKGTEKQALLETGNTAARADMLEKFMCMASQGDCTTMQ